METMDLSIGTVPQDSLTEGSENELSQAEVTENGIAVQGLDGTVQYIKADASGSYSMVQVDQDGNHQQVLIANPLAGVSQFQAVDEATSAAIQQATAAAQVQVSNGSIQLIQQPQILQTSALGAQTVMLTTDSHGGALGQVGGGPVYVTMSPKNSLPQSPGQLQVLAPGPGGGKMTTRTSRDERRRANHNEVEQRRRDKMNYWIVQMSKLVPSCADECISKTPSAKSKSGILEKSCLYVEELQNANRTMADAIKDVQIIANDNELLKAQVEELKHQNDAMKRILQENGIGLKFETGDGVGVEELSCVNGQGDVTEGL